MVGALEGCHAPRELAMVRVKDTAQRLATRVINLIAGQRQPFNPRPPGSREPSGC